MGLAGSFIARCAGIWGRNRGSPVGRLRRLAPLGASIRWPGALVERPRFIAELSLQ